MTTWNESTPAGTDYISGGDDIIRDTKTAIRERLGREHYMLGSGDDSDDGKHRLARGLAAARPAAVAGHVYISTDTQILSFAIADGVWIDLRADDQVGMIKMYGGSAPPLGWLVCNGNEVSRATYAALYATIGVYYGAGNGTTTFNLPDLKGRVAVGLDSSSWEFDVLGDVGGEKYHTLTSSEMPIHTHGVSDPQHLHQMTGDHGVVRHPGAGGTHNVGAGTTILLDSRVLPASTGISLGNAGGGSYHNNLQPFLTVNYVIKY